MDEASVSGQILCVVQPYQAVVLTLGSVTPSAVRTVILTLF